MTVQPLLLPCARFLFISVIFSVRSAVICVGHAFGATTSRDDTNYLLQVQRAGPQMSATPVQTSPEQSDLLPVSLVSAASLEVLEPESPCSNTTTTKNSLDPDMHSIVYLNPDHLHQTTESLTINGSDSTIPGTYTSISGNNVTLKNLDNDAMQGDGVHIWMAQGSGNQNNHVNLHIKNGGDGVYVYVATGNDNVNNTMDLYVDNDT
eukprot:TRINITY_DN63235_c0_g1_i1.p1 TRINITY_DN63235_c0_g1~~TRINITY_DN63235_c0_g1_i1.p1  ORF type:complete len:207 (-),score=23.23 TRINITY_DN63235_c0_g1_i1:115-735(-)